MIIQTKQESHIPERSTEYLYTEEGLIFENNKNEQ